MISYARGANLHKNLMISTKNIDNYHSIFEEKHKFIQIYNCNVWKLLLPFEIYVTNQCFNIKTFTNFRKPSQISITNQYLIKTSIKFCKNIHKIVLQITSLKKPSKGFPKYFTNFCYNYAYFQKTFFT